MARRAGGALLTPRAALRAALAVLVHPGIWGIALRQLRVLAVPGWWRRAPYLPLPAPDYLRFRLETASGGAGDQVPEAGDLVTYLRWCRDLPR